MLVKAQKFLLGWKEGKLAQQEEGPIAIRQRTQSQAGLGCSEPWLSPLLPIPFSPTTSLAYACCEQAVKSTGFFLPTWPERRWVPSKVSTLSSLYLEYQTYHHLL